MKTLAMLLIVTACMFLRPAPAPAAESAATAGGPYLLSYFRGNGETGLHLACSRDGYTWTALNGGRPLLAPRVGTKEILMRDPSIVQGPDGTFHMVWTTGWTDGRGIGYSSSKDLVQWSEQKFIPVMAHEPAARNCWAPELFHDQATGQFIILWSTTIPGRFPETEKSGDNGYNHRIYCTTTRDFETFTPTRLFYDPGFNVIDAAILHAQGRYHLIIKDETRHPVAKKNLRIASSDNVMGPYTSLSEPITISWVEGPSAIRIGGEYFIYFDHYARPQYYGAIRSKDLKTWEDVSKQMSFPAGARHGTVFQVGEPVLERLLKLEQAPAPTGR
jgi:beta-xylosidase